MRILIIFILTAHTSPGLSCLLFSGHFPTSKVSDNATSQPVGLTIVAANIISPFSTLAKSASPFII